MISEKLIEVLQHEGVVALVSMGEYEPHVVNSWNSYLQITESGHILGPVGTMKVTENNLQKNNKIKMTIGSREVEGKFSKGTGFLIQGTALFHYEGEDFNHLKAKYPWARAIFEIVPESIEQTL